MTMFLLTEADITVLKEIVADYRNKPARQRSLPPSVEDFQTQSPDVYIAVTPTEGIPATNDGVVGFATCEIYRLLLGQTDGDPRISSVRTTRRVYNPSSIAISGDATTVVWRDKFGHWFTMPLGEPGPAGSMGAGEVLGWVFTAADEFVLDPAGFVQLDTDDSFTINTGSTRNVEFDAQVTTYNDPSDPHSHAIVLELDGSEIPETETFVYPPEPNQMWQIRMRAIYPVTTGAKTVRLLYGDGSATSGVDVHFLMRSLVATAME